MHLPLKFSQWAKGMKRRKGRRRRFEKERKEKKKERSSCQGQKFTRSIMSVLGDVKEWKEDVEE